MAYSFTDPDVMHALAKRKNAEWTSVLLLMTRGIRTGKSGSDEIYQPAGHSSADCDAFPIHHDKVIIVDGNTVETAPITSLVLLHARIQRMSLC